MKRLLLRSGIVALISLGLFRPAAADTVEATAALNAPAVSVGGNAEFHWGPIVSQTNMTLQGAANVHYPQKFAGGSITAGHVTHCMNPGDPTSGPGTPYNEWYCGTPAPEYPKINFNDYRNLAIAEGNSCGGQACLNPPVINTDTDCFVHGQRKIWFFDNDVTISGGYFCGVLVTKGAVKFTGNGSQSLTIMPPSDAWKQYEVGTPSSGADSSAAGEYPGDSGFQQSAAPVTLSNVSFQGYVYATTGYNSVGGTVILGGVQFGQGASSSFGGTTLYFSTQTIIVEPQSGTVDQPIIFPGTECTSGSIDVTLIDGTPGASIYYSLDGTAPSVLYTGPIHVAGPATTTLLAKATAAGLVDSQSASATYTFSSTCGGGTVSAPALGALIPAETPAGSPAFTLTVNGSNFVSPAVVTWNGIDRTTTFVNAGQLTAAITAADVQAVGSAVVRVRNPDAQLSNPLTFTITSTGGGSPAPVLTSLSPNSQTAGSAAFTLIANGSNFASGAILTWNGSNRTTTVLGSTQLNAAISANDIANAGTATVQVRNPDAQVSGSLPFTITSLPLPTIHFSAATYSATEDSGFTRITVTRQGVDLSGISTVQFATTDDTAFAGKNYTRVSGSLTFASGDASKTFEVPLINDGLADGNKTILLTLSDPSGATLDTPDHAVLTITDAGAPPVAPPSAPFINQLIPFSALVTHAGSFTLRVLGAGFDASAALVVWNNGPTLPIVQRSTSEIDVTMDPALWANTPGSYPVIVRNPSMDSNAATFTVEPAGNPNPPPFVVQQPFADPNPTYTTTSVLSVLGGTLSPGGEAKLKYDWQPIGVQPQEYSFSENKSNGAKHMTATFKGPGIYRFKVVITDTSDPDALLSVETNELAVEVKSAAATLTLSPKYQVITPDQTPTITATVRDQFGALMNPDLVWTHSAGSLSTSKTSAVVSVNSQVRNVHITATLPDTALSDDADLLVMFGSGGVADLSNVSVGPIPYKSTSGLAGVTFRGLNPGIKIRIFSTDGRLVDSFESGNDSEKVWTLTNSHGSRVASGVYFYIVEGAGQKKEGKLVLIL